MTLNCIHIIIVTGSFLYWCVMRSASRLFFVCSCFYLRILIISYLATFLGTNSLSVLMCHKTVNQSIHKKMLLKFKTQKQLSSQTCQTVQSCNPFFYVELCQRAMNGKVWTILEIRLICSIDFQCLIGSLRYVEQFFEIYSIYGIEQIRGTVCNKISVAPLWNMFVMFDGSVVTQI